MIFVTANIGTTAAFTKGGNLHKT